MKREDTLRIQDIIDVISSRSNKENQTKLISMLLGKGWMWAKELRESTFKIRSLFFILKEKEKTKEIN